MTNSKYDDPEWIAEKMFGEEFDDQPFYYVVDPADEFVLYIGYLDDCEQFLETTYGGTIIIPFSALTPQMIDSIDQPF